MQSPPIKINRTELESLAKAVGLDAVGIAKIDRPEHGDFFLKWLNRGYHGEMYYMKNRAEIRLDPRFLLPEAKTLICFAWNYQHRDLQPMQQQLRQQQPSCTVGEVARYALGEDYHSRFKEKLREFWQLLQAKIDRPAKARFFTDSAPIMERDFAAQAGVGWIGKNCCLIHPQLGSWLFLGEIITELEIEPTPPMAQHCGTCTACLDACPTGALTAPYTLDSNRCISYLTIEMRRNFSDQERSWVGNHLFGCDICQEVCPWNRRAPDGGFLAEGIRWDLLHGNIVELASGNTEEFENRFSSTPISRTTYDGWERNLKTVASNQKKSS